MSKDLSISDHLFSNEWNNGENLSDSNLRLSQSLQMLCSEATSGSAIVGMSMASLASVFMRTKSLSLCSRFLGESNFAKNFSHYFSIGTGLVTEGYSFHLAPEFLRSGTVSTLNLAAGGASSTLTVAFSKLAGRGPQGFLLQQLSQDLAMISAQEVSGYLGWSERVQGSFSERWVGARITACQMQAGAGLLRLSCHEVGLVEGRLKLSHESHESILPQVSFARGWVREATNRVQELFLPQSANGLDARAALQRANEQTQERIKKSNLLFMIEDARGVNTNALKGETLTKSGASSILPENPNVAHDETTGTYQLKIHPTARAIRDYGAITGNLHALTAGVYPLEIPGFSGAFPLVYEALKKHIKMPTVQEVIEQREAALQGLILPVHISLKGDYHPAPLGQSIDMTLQTKVLGKGSRVILTASHQATSQGTVIGSFESKLTVTQDLSKSSPALIDSALLANLISVDVLPPLHVTRELIAQFRQASGDHNVIHGFESESGVPVDFAAKAVGLPDIILHGMATLNFANHVLYTVYADSLYPSQAVKVSAEFKGYALPGDVLTPLISRESLDRKTGKYTVHIINQNKRLIGVFSLEAKTSEMSATTIVAQGDSASQSDRQKDQAPSQDSQASITSITEAVPVRSKVAFMFPGQGSHSVGMGESLAGDPVYNEALHQAERSLPGITRLMREGPLEELSLTANTQPAILTMSVGIAALLAERGVVADFVAGHSLGEISALTAISAIPINQAPLLVAQRGRFMQEAVPAGVGAMAVVMRCSVERLREICNTVSSARQEVVEVVNWNSSEQLVISGHTGAVEAVMAKVKELKGIAKALPVSAPFHSSLMMEAQTKFASLLGKLSFYHSSSPLSTPLVSSTDGQLKRSYAEAFNALSRQMAAPVLWQPTVEQLLSLGVTTFIEVGPGSVLGGLVKRIAPKEVKILATDSPEKIDEVVTYCQSIGAVRAIEPSRFTPSTSEVRIESSPASITKNAVMPVPEILAKLDAMSAADPTEIIYGTLHVQTKNGLARIRESLTEAADLLPDLAQAVAKDPYSPVVILGPTGQMGRQFATLLLAAGHKNLVLWYFMSERSAKSAARILIVDPTNALALVKQREMENLVALQALAKTMDAHVVAVDASGRLIDEKGSYPLPDEIVQAVNQARGHAQAKTGKEHTVHFYNGFAGAPDMSAGPEAASTTPNLLVTEEGLHMALLPTPKDFVKAEGTIRTMGRLHDAIYEQLLQQNGWIGSQSNIVTLTWSSRDQLGDYLVSYSPTSSLGRAKALLEQTSRERYAASEQVGFQKGRPYTGHFPYFPSDASGAIFGMGLFQRVIGQHFKEIGAYPVPSRLAAELLIKTHGDRRAPEDLGADLYVDQVEKRNLGPVIETIRLVNERTRAEEKAYREAHPELSPDSRIDFDAETTARILNGIKLG